MIAKGIVFFDQPCVLACDAKCSKAWGINSRPSARLSDDPDDYAWLADGELGAAPEDPGTYEGGHAKPRTLTERLNKWCARECERSVLIGRDEDIELPSFAERRHNIPNKERSQ